MLRAKINRKAQTVISLLAFAAAALLGGRLSVAAAVPAAAGSSHPIIVATTTILADLTAEITGDRAEVHSLLRPGADPHSYQPVPADIRLLSKAKLFIVHGAGLDPWADRLVKATGIPVVIASQGLPQTIVDGEENPHYWLDPILVKTYVENIRLALCQVEPNAAAVFTKNARQLTKNLDDLHLWIEQQVAVLPPERRLLVTYHDTFHYFAARYGFTVLGSIVHSANPEAEPSAQLLADLARFIAAKKVPAIFTETTVNPKLAVALGTQSAIKTKIINLYTGSLSAPDGPAADYFAMMRFNTRTIVESLMK